MIDNTDVFESEELEDVYEIESNYASISSGEITNQNANSIQNAKDKVKSLTTDEFLIEAYTAATQLRNTLGDADALVSELSEIIRMNVLVVAATLKERPVELILASARALPDDARSLFLAETIEMLSLYKRSIESETINEAASNFH